MCELCINFAMRLKFFQNKPKITQVLIQSAGPGVQELMSMFVFTAVLVVL